MSKPAITPEVVSKALARQEPERTRVAKAILDVVHPAALAALRGHVTRHRLDRSETVREWVGDLMVRFFAHDGRVLRQWNPERGRTFSSWISFLTRHYIWRGLEALGSRPPTFSLEDESPWVDASLVTDARSLATTLAMLEKIQEFAAQSDGLELFDRLFLQQEKPCEVAQALGMTPNAVSQWKYKFTRCIKDHYGEPLVTAFWDVPGDWSRYCAMVPGPLIQPEFVPLDLTVSVGPLDATTIDCDRDSLFLGALIVSLLQQPEHWPAMSATVTVEDQVDGIDRRGFRRDSLLVFLRQMKQRA
ncbi:MAG: sigma-70 family RNA polymerase sigma factor [Myxococcales bacterium]|nr:sigma-70 family RNA polymerase sigma factor [Myxococcales bacterium]